MHGAKLRPNSRSCRNFSQTPRLISQRKVAVAVGLQAQERFEDRLVGIGIVIRLRCPAVIQIVVEILINGK